MKLKTKERRIINIDKDDFDKIKKYCDANAYNMSKWISKLALVRIKETLEGWNKTKKHLFELMNTKDNKSISEISTKLKENK